jgi:hypothetical protein
MLRADFAGTPEYQITTFHKLHGDLGSLPNEVEEDARRLYIYEKPGTGEAVWSLLEAFVETNRAELIAEVERITGD